MVDDHVGREELPRMSIKRERPSETETGEAADEDVAGEEAAVDEASAGAARASGVHFMRRPAASPKIVAKGKPIVVKPRAKKASFEAQKAHEALLARPAKVVRPHQTIAPTSHYGGKIYWSNPKRCYRVYLRASDRIEKVVFANPDDDADMRKKFRVCCAMIENDKRLVRAR